MKVLTILISLALTVLCFVTCVYNKEESLYPDLSNACDTTNITFKLRVAPVFSANCLSCHGNSVAPVNGGGVRLQDYPDVKLYLNIAYGSMSHMPGYRPMPKGMSGTIDSCQIKTVRVWKNAGAPDN